MGSSSPPPGPTQLVELLRGFKAETNDKVWFQLSQVLQPLDRVIPRAPLRVRVSPPRAVFFFRDGPSMLPGLFAGDGCFGLKAGN